ncbi:MAG: hypothetical protein ACO3CH_00220 [Ilumatobacteraceae bacterium]
MTFADSIVFTITNVLVTLAVVGFAQGGLRKLIKELTETKSELMKLRTMYSNADHRITEVVKKNAAIELIVTRAMHERLKALEKSVTLTGDGTQSS